MKKLLYILLGILVITYACQTETELTDNAKDAIIQAIKVVSQERLSLLSSTYDNETFNKYRKFFDENSEQIWQTEPVSSVTGVRVTYKQGDSGGAMFDNRLSTPSNIHNTHYSVLSENKVLEVLEGDFTIIMKDSTNAGTFKWIGTYLWANIDGEWKIQYSHSSYARQSE